MPEASVGPLELTILLSVVRLGDDAHGLAIRKDVSERTRRDYSVGAIYTTLERLTDKGFVSARMSEPLPVRGGRSRRHFKITAAGRRAIHAAQRESASIWAGVRNRIRPEPA